MARTLFLIAVLSTTACTHFGDQRMRSAVHAVMDHVDPNRAAVVIVREGEVERVRALLGDERPVVADRQFAKDHPDEAVPFNIAFQSVEARGEAYVVRVHVQAISNPPPMVLFCGSGYTFEVTRRDGKWVIRPIEQIVC